MSSYSIKVNCSCGKILKVPEKYAGKRVKCPCERKITIPTIDEIKKKIGEKPEELRNCPTCGAFLNKDDVICVACRMNLQTGEWDSAANTPYIKQKSMRFEYITTAALVILIIIAGIWALPGKNKADISGNENAIMVSDGNENMNSAILNIQRNMPEDSSLALKKKIEAYSGLVGSEITKAIQDLENKKYEIMAKEAYEQLPQEGSAIERWFALEQLANKFQGTDYATKIKSEQQKTTKEVVEFVSHQYQHLQEHVDSKNYHAIIMESFKFFNDIPYSLKANSEVKVELRKIGNLYEESLSNLQNKDQKDSSEENTTPETGELEKLIVRITNEVRPKYESLINNWEFEKALDLVAPIAFEAEKYSDSNSSEVKLIKEMHKNAIDYNKLWEIIEQGAEYSIGKDKLLYTKKRDNDGTLKDGFISGKIKGYKDNVISLTTLRGGDQKNILLTDLRADQLINELAIESDFPKEFVYGLALKFYRLNNMTTEAKYVVENKISSPTEEQQNILSWAKEDIDKIKKNQEDIDKKLQDEAELRKLEREELALERDKKRAWEYSLKLVGEFNAGNFEAVLDHLQVVKNTLPKAEVLKMSKRLGSQEGYSLKDFATKALEMCRLCAEGKIDCRSCLGTGIIEKELQLKDSKYIKKEYCKSCNGNKTIDCPRCATRRFSKPYNMLVEWYRDL